METIAQAAYLVAALLFILALAGLSRHETAKTGNVFGMAGRVLAFAATTALALNHGISGTAIAVLMAAVVIGAAVGLYRARVVEMTGMPELIALLHSFVGLAAVLVGWNGYLLVEADSNGTEAAALHTAGTLGVHHVEVSMGVFIGAVTFTGSIVAFLKLSARMKSTPLMLPGKNILNLGALGALVALASLTAWFVVDPQLWLLIAVTIIALLLGWHLVAFIGGGDMPVVVSMLNSYSGWAAAASGFLLSNDLLIIVGALVGSSGAYLSYIMCKAMNRSFISVIAGGLASRPGPATTPLTANIVRSMPKAWRNCSLPPTRRSSHRATAWSRAGAVRRCRANPQASRPPWCKRSLRHPPGGWAPTGSYECTSRRGQGSLRHSPRDGRDQ